MKKLLGTILLSLLKRSTALSEEYGKAYNHSLQVANDKLAKINLELEAKNAELELLSSSDPLTRIYNRRYFDTYLLKEWYRAQRSKDYMSLILCDLDHFQAYNEAYGYQTGNTCLQNIAKIVEHFSRRPYDLSARFNGKKFAVILAHTDTAGAMIIANGIKDEIAKMAIPHIKSPNKGIVTLSFGIATMVPEKDKNCSELISMAEEALYESKREGRDRISIKRVAEIQPLSQ